VEDHPLHVRQPLGVEEHVLGAAEADPLRPVLPRPRRVGRVVGVGPDLEAPLLVGPAEQPAQVRIVDVRHHGVEFRREDLAGVAVDRDPVPLDELPLADPDRALLEIDLERRHADHRRLAELPGDERRVARAAAAAGEDPLRREHAVDVVRLRLRTHHDHRPPLLRPLLGAVGVEHDLPHRGAGGDVEPDRQPVAGPDRPLHLHPVVLRVEEEIDLLGGDAEHRLLGRDQPLVDHVDGDPDRRLRGALRVPRLKHPELAALDRELHVLHLAVMLLEPLADLLELRPRPGHLLLEELDRFRLPDPGDHVLALRVDEIVALDLVLAGGAGTGHRHAGGRVVAEVAEDHRADVHRGAEVVRDLRRLPVVEGALAVPAPEDRLGGEPDLRDRILRELLAGMLPHDLLELGRDRLPGRGVELGVGLDSGLLPGRGEDLLERLVGHPHHDRAEHLDQAPVAVVGEPLVAGELRHPLDDRVVHADVEDGVHHPRHRELRAGAAGDEERVGRIAEPLAGLPLEPRERRGLLLPEARREALASREIGVAGGGRDREARRHRHPDPRHVGEVRPLAPEQPPQPVPAPPGRGLGGRQLVEPIDPLLAHLNLLIRATAERHEAAGQLPSLLGLLIRPPRKILSGSEAGV